MNQKKLFSFVLSILIIPLVHSADGRNTDPAAPQNASRGSWARTFSLFESGAHPTELDSPDIPEEIKEEYRQAEANYAQAQQRALCPTATACALCCTGCIGASVTQGITTGSYTLDNAIMLFIVGPLASAIPALATHTRLTHTTSRALSQATYNLTNHRRFRAVPSTSAQVAPARQTPPTMHTGAIAVRAEELLSSPAALPSQLERSSRFVVTLPEIDPHCL